MSFRVVVAARGGDDAKSRLAARLGPSDRQALVEAMLADMLFALRECPEVTRVYVSTPTPALARVAARLNAVVLLEPAESDLNLAFEAARTRIAAVEPESIVAFLPGDLPRLDANELARCAAAAKGGVVVVAPTLADGGTGALVFRADTPFRFAFGPDSLDRHLSVARALGAETRVMPAPSLGFDLDQPSDLEAFLAGGGEGGRTGALLWRLASSKGAAA